MTRDILIQFQKLAENHGYGNGFKIELDNTFGYYIISIGDCRYYLNNGINDEALVSAYFKIGVDLKFKEFKEFKDAEQKRIK